MLLQPCYTWAPPHITALSMAHIYIVGILYAFVNEEFNRKYSQFSATHDYYLD